MLVLGDRQDAERVGHRLAGEEAETPGTRGSLRGVDADDPRVRHRRAHQAHVAHAREAEVIGEAGDAGHLGAPVDPAEGLADQPGLSRSGSPGWSGSFGRSVGGLANRLSHRRPRLE